MKILYLLSIIFIYITLINSQTISSQCIWWVDFKGNSTTANGSLENPFFYLQNAIDTVTGKRNKDNLCGYGNKNITRVIYIIGSNETFYVQSSISVSDVSDYEFGILIQSVDRPNSTYQFDGTLLPFNPMTYAVFVGSPNTYTINFQSVSTNFTLRGIEFRDGGFAADNLFKSTVIASGVSTVSFDYCKFTNNSGGDTGALYYNSQYSTSITNCTFTNNTATSNDSYGGALYIPYTTTKSSIIDITFINNSATYGGAMYCNHQNLLLKSIEFLNNTAIYGGGLYTEDIPKTHIVWNLLNFKFNNAQYGGGLYDKSSFNFYNHSTFENNIASKDGGAAYLFDSVITIVLTNFNSNIAKQGGGAVYVTDGTESDKVNQMLIKDSNFTMNSASNGGALYCVDAIARFNANDRYLDTNTATNTSTNIDYCLSSCVTTAGDCGCPGGCGISKSNDKNPNSNAKIAVAIFLPITLILLGIVVFLLWKTHSKSKIRNKVAPYDEIRLSPQSQDNDEL